MSRNDIPRGIDFGILILTLFLPLKFRNFQASFETSTGGYVSQVVFMSSNVGMLLPRARLDLLN